MMRKLFRFGFYSLLALSFMACNKSILSDDPGDIRQKNVRVDILPYFNNYYYSPDSLYYAGGAFLKIDELSIIHSNFFMVDEGDTLPEDEPVEWKLSENLPVYIGNLDVQSYSGRMYYNIGLNDEDNDTPPAFYPEGSLLYSDRSLYRGTNEGYNFVTLTGRVQDPNKPFSEPTIPFKWVIATNDLAMVISQPRNFSVAAGKDVTFGVKLQLDKLFEGLYPLITPIIKSDFDDNTDWNNAETLKENFINKVYLLQI